MLQIITVDPKVIDSNSSTNCCKIVNTVRQESTTSNATIKTFVSAKMQEWYLQLRQPLPSPQISLRIHRCQSQM